MTFLRKICSVMTKEEKQLQKQKALKEKNYGLLCHSQLSEISNTTRPCYTPRFGRPHDSDLSEPDKRVLSFF